MIGKYLEARVAGNGLCAGHDLRYTQGLSQVL